MSLHDLFSWVMAIAVLQEKNVPYRAMFYMDSTRTRQNAAELSHASIQAGKTVPILDTSHSRKHDLSLSICYK